MRLHTNSIAYTQTIREALKAEQAAGRIASHVSFKTLQPHASRSHQFAFEVQLEAGERDRGRRAGNSGSYGAMRPEYDGYAATYDEWGWLIAALYKIDPSAMWGSAAHPQYENAEHFHDRTGWSYNPDALIRELEHGWVGDDGTADPYPFISARVPEQVGRRGYGRTSGENIYTTRLNAAMNHPGKRKGEWLHYMPRTVEQVRAFARLDTVPA